MAERPVSRYPIPKLETLPEDVRERIQAVQAKTGFIPNVYLALAHRPDEFRAFFAYYDALMQKEAGGITKAEREMIVVATSSINHCEYCVVAHGAILRIYAKNPVISDQIAINYRKAEITPRQRAMLDFAVKVAAESHKITEEDYRKLKDYGLNDEDIWDIGAIAALFALSNRMANLISLRANREFYSIAR
jgi:uncharacterized peroxidase-related enzyme